MDFYLQQVLDVIESTAQGMDPGQMQRHRPGKWSSAEILEHLSRTFSGTVKAMQRVLDAGKPLARRPRLRERIAVGVVVELGYFPSGRPAPEFTLPRGVPAEHVLSEINEHVRAMDQTIAACERQFGSSVKIADHPVLGPLSTRQWRKFHWVHTCHHMKQIAALRLIDSA